MVEGKNDLEEEEIGVLDTEEELGVLDTEDWLEEAKEGVLLTEEGVLLTEEDVLLTEGL